MPHHSCRNADLQCTFTGNKSEVDTHTVTCVYGAMRQLYYRITKLEFDLIIAQKDIEAATKSFAKFEVFADGDPPVFSYPSIIMPLNVRLVQEHGAPGFFKLGDVAYSGYYFILDPVPKNWISQWDVSTHVPIEKTDSGFILLFDKSGHHPQASFSGKNFNAGVSHINTLRTVWCLTISKKWN